MTKLLQKGARTFVLLWWLIQFSSAPVHGCLLDRRHNFIDGRCACNFMGACSLDSNKKYQPFKSNRRKFEATYVPDIKMFAGKPPRVANICEPGNIGIIYDCQNRMPLASTIVLTKNDYESEYSSRKRKRNFDNSEKVQPNYRQSANDYEGSSTHQPCYKSRMGKMLYDQSWYGAIKGDTIGVGVVCGKYKKTKPAVIHRGHLIAAQYGRGDRVAETFVYTNVVPQFGILNSGAWNKHESFLIKWARTHCNGFPIHIVVGSVPSTFGANQPRFFGKGGFSDYQETSNSNPEEHFAINVPSLMWTVACCGSGSDVKNTGFFAANLPIKQSVKPISPFKLLQWMKINDRVKFNFFPNAKGRCENDKNYQKLAGK